jgi:hypothetical protein
VAAVADHHSRVAVVEEDVVVLPSKVEGVAAVVAAPSVVAEAVVAVAAEEAVAAVVTATDSRTDSD